MRYCVSSVSDPTGYRLTYGDDGKPVSVVSTVYESSVGDNWQYRIEAMPLQIPAKTTSRPSTSTEQDSVTIYLHPEVTTPASSADGTRQLSRGAIAGVVIGSILAASVAAAVLFVWFRRRRHRNDHAAEATVVGQGVDSYFGKAELPTFDAVRAEMDGHATYYEMDGKSLPAEALSPHTIAEEQPGAGVGAETKQPDGGAAELPNTTTGK
ncbi:acid protease [Apiospora sp. TS-2023a]